MKRAKALGWSRSDVGKRTKRSVRRLRSALLAKLGGRCAKCGAVERLEFDHHPEACTWEPQKVSQWIRIARYRREAAKGQLRVLCRSCNAKDGSRRYWDKAILAQEAYYRDHPEEAAG